MRYASAVLVSVLITAHPVAAQQHPDLSGTWVLDTRRSDSAHATDGTRISSATLEIAQTDSEMRVDAVRNGVRQVLRYPFKSPEPPRAVGTAGRVGTVVEWDGDTLVTITPHEVNGMAVTTTERRTLSAGGRELIVVTHLQVQHGYEGTAARNYSSPVRDVYVLQKR